MSRRSLFNALAGVPAAIVSPVAGTTRDSIEIDWDMGGRPVKLFDTAGMRKRARIEEKLEKMSVQDSLRAIRFAEVVVVLLDATIPFEKQDLQIADLVIREMRGQCLGLAHTAEVAQATVRGNAKLDPARSYTISDARSPAPTLRK